MNVMGVLRIPERIELAGLDLAEYHGRYMSEAEVAQAEREHARQAGYIKGPAE
jgi:hypothetical protein